MSRALIVANKTWEADPLVEVLMSSAASKPFGRLKFERAADGEPRWRRGRVADGAKQCEILCLQDALAPAVNQSSSAEKAKVLPAMLAGDDVRLVIAFGTAATFGEASNNGSVVVGSSVFLHDPKSPRSDSDWEPGNFDTLVPSALDPSAFAVLFTNAADAIAVDGLLIAPPHNSAAPRPALLAEPESIALSEVNITKYVDYVWSDLATVATFIKPDLTRKIGSLETTHGVIRFCTNAPFAFVSGIVDRVGHFNDEVDDAQNFVGGRNAGIAIAYFIPRMLLWLP